MTAGYGAGLFLASGHCVPIHFTSVTVRVGRIVTVLHVALVRLRRCLSRCRIGAGGYRKGDAREHERADDGFRGLRKHYRSSFLLNHVEIVDTIKASSNSHFQFLPTPAHRLPGALSPIT